MRKMSEETERLVCIIMMSSVPVVAPKFISDGPTCAKRKRYESKQPTPSDL